MGAQMAHPVQHLRQPGPAGDRRLLRALHLRLRASADRARARRRCPTARPRSLITGERMEKIEWGPNWEEILGGEFAKRSKDCEFRGRAEGDLRPVRKHLHDVSAAAVRALPQSGLRRGLPVGRDLQARGGRHRPDRPGQVPRLAHVRLGLPLQEDLLQLVSPANRRSASSAIRASKRASRRCARKPASGRIRYLGVMLYDADRIEEAAVDARRRRPLRGAARSLPRSERPEGSGAGARRRHARSLAGGGAGLAGLEDGDGVEGRLPAASRIPHAADGLVRAAAVADPAAAASRQDRARSAACRTCSRCAFRSNISPTC